jgi:hypothetical protein
MQTDANPLHRPKPAREETLLHGRFYFTDEQGRLEHTFGTHVFLTSEHLRVTPELSIPLARIASLELVEKRGLVRRRFLRIVFVNPITGGPECVTFCKPDPIGIGLYRAAPLRELHDRIQELRARAAQVPPALPAKQGAQQPSTLDRCEVCGARPAYYVPYLYQISAVLVSYRSAAKRRIHCRKHNVLPGLGCYALTALTGWIGIGVFAYPFVVFTTARNLSPSLGRASYALGFLPTIAVAALVASWIV